MTEEYKCPLCKAPLASTPGTQLDPTNGVTLYCRNRQCPSQEVAGHGDNAKAAYRVVLEKFEKYAKDQEES